MDDTQLLKNNNVEIIKLIGSGDHGRSKVYLGYHADFGIVAAKVMRIGRFDSNEFFKIGALNKPEFASPFIMKCFKAKPFSPNVVILMEYANAKSLELIFKDNKRKLSIGTLRALAQQILEGVRVIHAAGLIHKNIKTGNIMLHSANGGIQIKISNLGIQKVELVEKSDLIDFETMLCMAPELLLGGDSYTNKV
ncbi:MAG: hypothetical protein EZS28_038762 [Streblomastix strix]|uniref:Protein kinase domain-containing protein n=1 Tax=Streblomastix strix TaxID=222440 RepID=A0A5J4U775_9EUKA|nr:MAG: hypothetical protein EZS28_038762 [Streblomastix strix]